MLANDPARAAEMYELADELAPSAPALRNAARARLAAGHRRPRPRSRRSSSSATRTTRSRAASPRRSCPTSRPSSRSFEVACSEPCTLDARRQGGLDDEAAHDTTCSTRSPVRAPSRRRSTPIAMRSSSSPRGRGRRSRSSSTHPSARLRRRSPGSDDIRPGDAAPAREHRLGAIAARVRRTVSAASGS